MKYLKIGRKNLVEICNQYLNDVEKVSKEVCAVFNINKIQDLRSNNFYQFVFKKENFDLHFHGSGVRILKFGKELFDFDFGHDIHVCGLDPFRLYQYLKKEIEDFNLDENDLKSEFEKLTRVGRFKRIGFQYFICNKENKDKLKKYKHNNY